MQNSRACMLYRVVHISVFLRGLAKAEPIGACSRGRLSKGHKPHDDEYVRGRIVY